MTLLILLIGYFTIGVSHVQAAFPTVASTNSGTRTTNGATSAINLPSGIQNGDLLMVFFSKDGTAAPTSITGTGWAALSGTSNGASYYIAYWKIADGTDSLTVNHASEQTSHISYRITGHDPNEAPAQATLATGSSANPNPPSLNRAVWTGEEILWIASYGWDAESSHNAFPSNYSTAQTAVVHPNTEGSGVAASARQLIADTEDPGTATVGASKQWAAQTYAIRQAPVTSNSGGITVQGVAYNGDDITRLPAGKIIVAAVGTSTPSLHSTTTDSLGRFSIQGIATSSPSAFAAQTAAGNNDAWYGITYGNGLFVAVAECQSGGPSDTCIITSPDGVTWTPRTVTPSDPGFNPAFNDVTFGNGMFVAVARTFTYDTVWYSRDGINWSIGTGGYEDWNSVTYGNGRFVAVGNNGGVGYSDDGINWTTVSALGNDDPWTSVTHANGRFVAVASCEFFGDCVMHSTNGATWTLGSIAGDNDNWRSVVYGNGRFVAVANGGSGGPDTAYSTDGINWTTSTNSVENAFSLVYANGYFIAKGINSVLYISEDGNTWTTQTMLGDNDDWKDAVYGAGKIVTVGANGDRVATAAAGFGEDTPITLFVNENATTSNETATTLTFGINNNSGTTTINADIIADTVLLHKPSIASSSNEIYLSTADFYDQLNDSDILFTATGATTTIEADMLITSDTVVYGPSQLNIDGDFTNYGTFRAGRGEVVANATTYDVASARYTGATTTPTSLTPYGITLSDSGLHLYVTDIDRDSIDQYVLSTPGDIRTAAYVRSTSTALYEGDPSDIDFSTDGFTMFFSGTFGNNAITEYALSTAWDISTAAFTQSFNPANTDQIQAFDIIADGTKLYLQGYGEIFEYELTTPWDISTATYTNNTFSLPSLDTYGMELSPDGAFVYSTDDSDDRIFITELTTPGNLATAQSAGVLLLGDTNIYPSEIAFAQGGSRMYVSAYAGANSVMQYRLDDLQLFTGNFTATSSLWDLTVGNTATLSPAAQTEVAGNYHVAGSAAGPDAGLVTLTGTSSLSGGGHFGFVTVTGDATTPVADSVTFTDLTIASGGEFTAPYLGKLNITGDFNPSAGTFNNNSAVNNFSGNGTYSNNLTSVSNFSIAPQDLNQNGLAFSTDGLSMYVHGYNGANPLIYEYRLATPWDITTASFIQSSSTAAQDTYGIGLAFSPDGTRLITGGYDSDNLNSYALTNPWDISTLRFETATSVASQTSVPTDVKVSPDGTRVYLLSETRVIYQYDLSEPFNVATAQFIQSEILLGMSGFPISQGMDFSNDGSTVLIGGNNGLIYKYTLITPWDISSSVYIGAYDNSASTKLLNFSSDGTDLFLMSGDIVYRYAITAEITTSTGTNTLGSATFLAGGSTVFTGNASTTRILIEADATVTAPAALTTGDFIQNGTFNANGGTLFSTGRGLFDGSRARISATSSLPEGGFTTGMHMSPNEEHFYQVLPFSDGGTIVWYQLGVPGNLSTLTTITGSYLLPLVYDITMSPDGTRLYAGHRDNKYVGQYALSTPWDITTASFVASTTFAALTGDSSNDIGISPDGRFIHVLGGGYEQALVQYELTTPWDITSAVLTYSGTEYGLSALNFTPDGLRMQTMESFGRIKPFTLSEPWNLATAVSIIGGNFGFNTLQQEVPVGIVGGAFNEAFDALYVANSEGPNLVRYDLPATIEGTLTGINALNNLTVTGGYTYLLDQASTTNLTIGASSELTTPLAGLTIAGSLDVQGELDTQTQEGTIFFTGDSETIGGNLTGVSALSRLVIDGTYTLTSPASTTGLTIQNGASLTAPSGTLSIAGSYINDGTFTAGTGSVVIETPQPSSRAVTQEAQLDISGINQTPTGVTVSDDGSRLYVLEQAVQTLHAYSLARPYMVDSASILTSVDLSSSLDNSPEDVIFADGGERMFILNTAEGYVAAYGLSTPWDIDTLSLVATSSRGGIRGGFFKPDGTKFYWTQWNSALTYEDRLSTPWDLSSVASSVLMSPGDNLGVVTSATISPDGTRVMYVDGLSQRIHAIRLDIPYDITSMDVGYEASPGLGEIFIYTGASGSSLSPDGKYLYYASFDDDRIWQLRLYDEVSLAGTMTGTSAFNQLVQNARTPMTFAGAASTTDTFTITPTSVLSGATTTVFEAGNTYTFENIDWAGANENSEVLLRSSASGTTWYLDIPGSQLNVEYVNVQDSDATLTTGGIVAATSTDSGNNCNWNFGAGLIFDCDTLPPTAPVWNATDWTFYDTITISAANIDEELTDFPVYVDLSDLSPQFWATTPSSAALVGTDIRVTTADNVEVPRELVFASSTLETGELHFRAPTISATTDTVFKIWYNGNTFGDYARDATYGTENVWTNEYVAVLHLNETGNSTAGGYLDSTDNGFNGTGESMTSASRLTGKLGGGQDFDGTADKIFLSGAVSVAELTMSAWMNIANGDLQGCDGLIFSRGTSVTGLNVGSCENGAQVGYSWNDDPNTWLWTGGPAVVTDAWAYVAVSVSGSEAVTYSNNASSTNTIAHSATTLDDIRIGEDESCNCRYINGAVDEVRIASTSRSTAWLSAEYLNQATTTDFYTVNAVEPPAAGTSTITNHSAGQVSNAFSFQSVSDGELFAFRITPGSETATTTNITFTLNGVRALNPANFSNLRIYRDNNSNRVFNSGTDTLMASGGNITVTGQSGTISFTQDFAVAAAADYLLVADWTSTANGSQVSIYLYPEDVTMIEPASGAGGTQTITGSVTSVQHARVNRGGGGGSRSAVGDPAPEGDGEVGGGTNEGGEVIGDDPNFRWPTANSGSWNNGANAYDRVDGTYASTNANATHTYQNHTFNVPSSAVIEGVQVNLEVSGTSQAGTIGVQLSWDGGTSWTETENTPTLNTTDTVVSLGGLGDTWGRSWTGTQFSDELFRLRLVGNPSSNTIQVDAIQVQVHFNIPTPPGSGGGGGGAI